MSAQVISMEDWHQARFMDWAVRFCVHALEKMPKRERERFLRRIKKDFGIDEHGG